MDICDSIAMASMSLSNAKFQMDLGITMAKRTMEDQEAAAIQLLDMLPNTPGLGEHIDVLA